MSATETLLALAAILILIDILFVSDIPTLIAYGLITIAITKNFEIHFLYKVILGILLIASLVTFHYLVWREFLEKINDRVISPQKHISGGEGLIGQYGVIQEIDGRLVILVGDQIFKFRTNLDIKPGERHQIKAIDSAELIL
jgi:membrane protein implicated in regulation of membrane protease activity